jgi:hypothetical protein
VKLTWDQDDPNRVKYTSRTLTRDEIEDQDFKDFLASSGSESDDEDPYAEGAEAVKAVDRKAKKAAMKERTEKLRALLLGGGEDDGDVWGKAGTPWQDELKEKGKKGEDKAGKNGKDKDKGKGKKEDVGMEITFRPGLSVAKASEAVEEEEETMTSLEKYQKRMKEKKERKREKLEMKHALKAAKEDGPVKGSTAKDDFFGDDSADDEPRAGSSGDGKAKPVVKNSKAARPTTSVPPAAAEAEALIDDSSLHFSMKDILKAEKAEGKRKKRTRPSKAKKEAEAEAMGRTREVELGDENFKIDVKDARFRALHEEAEFAIDPSNPQ